MLLASSAYLALLVVFAVSGGAKLRRPSWFAERVADYGLIGPGAARLAAPVIVAAELVTAGLLAAPATRAFGAWLAAGLLAVFLGAVSSAWLRGREVPCACFGGTGALDTVGPASALRTLALLLLAVVAALAPAAPFHPVQPLLAVVLLLLVALLSETVRITVDLPTRTGRRT